MCGVWHMENSHTGCNYLVCLLFAHTSTHTCVWPSNAVRVASYIMNLLNANAICSTNSSSSFFSPISWNRIFTCMAARTHNTHND